MSSFTSNPFPSAVLWGFQKTGMGTNDSLNIANYIGLATGKPCVPLGWRAYITSVSMFVPTVPTNAGTLTGFVYVGATLAAMASIMASFSTLIVTGNGSSAELTFSVEPTAPPYLIDASAARQLVDCRTTLVNGGTNSVAYTIYGYLVKA